MGLFMPRLVSSFSFRRPTALTRGSQCVVHDSLCLAYDGLQMLLVAETLRVNLVNVFRAGRTRREPSTRRHDFQAADGGVVAGSARQLGGDRITGKVRFLHGFRRKLGETCFL